MNDSELLEALKIAGRYEVVSFGDNSYTVIPRSQNEILITAESHEECVEFFNTRPD